MGGHGKGAKGGKNGKNTGTPKRGKDGSKWDGSGTSGTQTSPQDSQKEGLQGDPPRSTRSASALGAENDVGPSKRTYQAVVLDLDCSAQFALSDIHLSKTRRKKIKTYVKECQETGTKLEKQKLAELLNISVVQLDTWFENGILALPGDQQPDMYWPIPYSPDNQESLNTSGNISVISLGPVTDDRDAFQDPQSLHQQDLGPEGLLLGEDLVPGSTSTPIPEQSRDLIAQLDQEHVAAHLQQMIRDAVQDLKSQNMGLQNEIKHKDDIIDNLKRQVNDLQNELDQLSATNLTNCQALDEQKVALNQCQQALAECRKDQPDQIATLGEQVQRLQIANESLKQQILEKDKLIEKQHKEMHAHQENIHEYRRKLNENDGLIQSYLDNQKKHNQAVKTLQGRLLEQENHIKNQKIEYQQKYEELETQKADFNTEKVTYQNKIEVEKTKLAEAKAEYNLKKQLLDNKTQELHKQSEELQENESNLKTQTEILETAKLLNENKSKQLAEREITMQDQLKELSDTKAELSIIQSSEKELRSQLNEKMKDYEEKEKELHKIQSDLESEIITNQRIEHEVGQLRDKVSDLQQEIEIKKTEYRTLELNKQRCEIKLRTAEVARNDLQLRLDECQENLKQSRLQLSQGVENDIELKQQQLAQSQDTANTLQQELSYQKSQVASYNQEIRDLNHRITEGEHEIQNLRRLLDTIKDKLNHATHESVSKDVIISSLQAKFDGCQEDCWRAQAALENCVRDRDHKIKVIETLTTQTNQQFTEIIELKMKNKELKKQEYEHDKADEYRLRLKNCENDKRAEVAARLGVQEDLRMMSAELNSMKDS